MEDQAGIPDNVPCPYCGAANAPDGGFCGACFEQLHIPAQVRAAAKAGKLLLAAPGPGPAGAAAETPAAAEARPAYRLWVRAALLLALFLFYTRWLTKENYFSPLDLLNLPFHEAGHIFLGFFGRFIMMLGGTLFQLLIPAVCLVSLLRRGANLGWQLCLFWLGQSLLNVSVYAGDAINQALPLVGGGEHDWTYLLTETGLLAHTRGVARTIFLAGSAAIFSSFYLIGRDAAAREPLELGNEQWGIK